MSRVEAVPLASPRRTSALRSGDTVVVTGIGLSTGLGIGREATWAAMKAGRSALRVLDRPDCHAVGRLIACPLPATDWQGDDDPVHALLEQVTAEALRDGCLDFDEANVDRRRVGTVIGLSKGGVRSLARVHNAVHEDGVDQSHVARQWLASWPGYGATLLARRFDWQGPTLAPVAACATGVVAVLQGADLIRRGLCDVVVAGAADASLEPILLAAFRRMKVLAHDTADPTRAVRPWDRARSGFVVGEGGAILVLERSSHAAARGVASYAEIAGGALGSDAYHETDLNPDPSGLAHLIEQALERSHVDACEIDHVNVHGTATRTNDPIECRALRKALGRHADRVACSANKSQFGHLLGAAGAAELAVACLAIRDRFVPPTLNLMDPDPACDLDGTPLVGRPLEVNAALKVSIGFGGHLAAAALRRPSGSPCAFRGTGDD